MTKTTGKVALKAAIWAGLVAGAVFMILEMALVQLSGQGSMWGPPRMIAAMVLGEDVLPPPASFDVGAVPTAMVIHFSLSLIYAFFFAWFLARWDLGATGAAVAGAAFGLAIYVINFYGFTAVFPWFAEARGGIAILAHAIFGLLLGTVYRLTSPRSHAPNRSGTA